jgi:hypothetical protein
MDARAQRFTTVVAVDDRGRAEVPVPFQPDEVWGPKSRHHVAGTLNGFGLRAVVSLAGDGHAFVLGPAWCASVRLTSGEEVAVVLTPEGPQRDEIAADIATALDEAPDAGAFFDSLAQFYRNAYLRYIEATKRRPELRPKRIAEVIRLLQQGIKERPPS